jgi:hypothetical protein
VSFLFLSFPTRRSRERESIQKPCVEKWIPARLLKQASGMTGENDDMHRPE